MKITGELSPLEIRVLAALNAMGPSMRGELVDAVLQDGVGRDVRGDSIMLVCRRLWVHGLVRRHEGLGFAITEDGFRKLRWAHQDLEKLSLAVAKALVRGTERGRSEQ